MTDSPNLRSKEVATATLMAMLSPAYPIGAFSYSHGLEYAIDEGKVACRETAQKWISAIVSKGSGWTDSLLIKAAFDACDNPADMSNLNDLALSLSAGAERRLETERLGQAFAKVTNQAYNLQLPPYALPVTFGKAAADINAELPIAIALYLQSLSSNLISVAVRLIPIGQSDGQTILAELIPLFNDQAKSAMNASLDDLGTSCFSGDLASMLHETLQPRIFQT